MFGDVSLGLGEYLTLWLIIAVAVIAVLGVVFGSPIGGAILFFIGLAAAILVAYVILARVYTFLLHGELMGSKSDGGGGGGT